MNQHSCTVWKSCANVLFNGSATTDRVCALVTQYIKDGFVDSAPAPGACVKSSCCGEGTVWQEGAGCIPTRSGMIDACKAKRGKWAWTCDAEEFCSS